MPAFSAEVPHTLGQTTATARLRGFVDEVRQQYQEQVTDVSGEWNDHSLDFSLKTFGFLIQGTLTVEENVARVEGRLPLAAALFRGQIERSIASELTRVEIVRSLSDRTVRRSPQIRGSVCVLVAFWMTAPSTVKVTSPEPPARTSVKARSEFTPSTACARSEMALFSEVPWVSTEVAVSGPKALMSIFPSLAITDESVKLCAPPLAVCTFVSVILPLALSCASSVEMRV